MRACVVVLGITAACGRVDFAPQVDAGLDAPGPDAPSGPAVTYAMDDDPSTGRISGGAEGFDGTCTRCPTQTTGIRGNAYAFDAADEVRLPAATSALIGVRPYTVTLWLRAATMQQSSIGVVFAKPFSQTTDANVFSVWVNMDNPGQVFFETTPTGAAGAYEFVSTPLGIDVRDAWHHVTASWDGAMKRLYIDGALVAAQAAQLVDSTELAALGVDFDANTPTLHYRGDIDELAIYTRALADAEIAALATP